MDPLKRSVYFMGPLAHTSYYMNLCIKQGLILGHGCSQELMLVIVEGQGSYQELVMATVDGQNSPSSWCWVRVVPMN